MKIFQITHKTNTKLYFPYLLRPVAIIIYLIMSQVKQTLASTP